MTREALLALLGQLTDGEIENLGIDVAEPLFPGSDTYAEASQNDTLQALIDRKLERSAVTGMRDLVLFFENKLA